MVANDNKVQLCHKKQFYEAQSYETSMEYKTANWIRLSPEPA